MTLPTPSQTVGPFFLIGLPSDGATELVRPGDPDAVRVVGHVFDGEGAPVVDALIEVWQANRAGRYDHPEDGREEIALEPGFRGFGRCETDGAGAYGFVTVKPGPVPHPDGGTHVRRRAGRAALPAHRAHGVTPEMRVYSEESFGPVVGIIDVDGPDEAVEVANDTEYGLAAAVFGRHVPTALEVARRSESGICHVNGSTVHDEAQMPFGGVKASGWGRFGGTAALDEFTELRWMTVQSGSRHYPLRAARMASAR